MRKKIISILILTVVVGFVIFILKNAIIENVEKELTPEQKFLLYFNSGQINKIPELFYFCSEPESEKRQFNQKRLISHLQMRRALEYILQAHRLLLYTSGLKCILLCCPYLLYFKCIEFTNKGLDMRFHSIFLIF